MKIVRIAVLLLIGSTAVLMALDTAEERATLCGVKTIDVVVEELRTDEIRDGLTKDRIRTDVELRLKKAGVVVDSQSSNHLYVQANLLKRSGEEGLYVYNLSVSLSQPVTVAVNHVSSVSSTWSVEWAGVVSPNAMSRQVRNDIGNLVDKFLDAYLSVNPK